MLRRIVVVVSWVFGSSGRFSLRGYNENKQIMEMLTLTWPSSDFLLSSLSNINLAARFLAIFLLEPVAVTESPPGTLNTACSTTTVNT